MAIEIERPPVAPDYAWGSGPMDEWMMDWLAASADSLVGQAPAVAAELLAQAVGSIPAGSAKHGWMAGRLADAPTGPATGRRPCGWRSGRSATAADPDLVVDLHWTLAPCRMMAGSSAESITTLDRALASPGLSAKHRARLLVLAARSYQYLGELDAADREADGALASAQEVDDAWATGWALHVLALGAMIRGDLADALPLYDRGLSVTETDPGLTDLGAAADQQGRHVVQPRPARRGAHHRRARAGSWLTRWARLSRVGQAHGLLSQLFFETGGGTTRWPRSRPCPTDLKEPTRAATSSALPPRSNSTATSPRSRATTWSRPSRTRRVGRGPSRR